AGAFGFLTKPINYLSLSTSIEMALNKHRSEQEVRRHRIWLESVLESLPDGVAVVDPHGKVRFLNRFAKHLLRKPGAWAIGSDASELLAFSGAGRFWSKLLADPPVSGRGPSRLPEGVRLASSGLVIEGEVAPTYDGSRFAGIILTFRDATERAREERNRRQAEKMQALGRLAARIAHDFNNLLCVMVGAAHEIGFPESTPEARDLALSDIQKATQSATQIVHQLLDFSRKEPPQTSLVHLDSLLENMRDIFARLLGPTIGLTLMASPGLAPIRADEGQIRQILINLVANARDAMPHGGAFTLVAADEGESIRLVASDTGIGMTQATAGRLFEPFFTTKPRGQGTGLGLSIVHGIVTDLGGSIEVESEPGRGAIFTILLPAERAG
ncbi:MAG: PAS domain-containing protein, partial [Acidobacteriota bacterium]|nr:PAS domain-containing protein [Acidobacteriota bacterium]